MAKRVANRRILEWVSEMVACPAGGGDVRAVISLNLDDDEVAEIRKIETEISIGDADLAGDDAVDAQCMLSMDPSAAIANPYTEVQYEDLETIHSHRVDMVCSLETSGLAVFDTTFTKQTDFQEQYPVLLATNPSFIAIDDGNIDIDYYCRIWFTRRKSVGNELARTLLKRR